MADVPLLVLIVDDEPEIRDILKEMLNENGIASITAASGNEAILRLRNRSVVAVLSDIRMAEGTGMQLLRTMRAEAIRTPVIFVSSSDDRDSMRSAIQLGAFDFITKPFTEAEVIKVTRAAIEEGIRIKEIEYELSMNAPSEKQNELILEHMDKVTQMKAKRGKG